MSAGNKSTRFASRYTLLDGVIRRVAHQSGKISSARIPAANLDAAHLFTGELRDGLSGGLADDDRHAVGL